MNPRESDPTGAFTGGGSAGLEDGTASNDRREPDGRDDAHVDDAEREAITSGIAATSEVADREAQEDAAGQGDGPPLAG
jgi:hypothetical protein